MLRSTKKTSVENTLVFCLARHLKSHPRGWIRTASTRRTVRRGKKPLRGFFRCAARVIHPRPPKELNAGTGENAAGWLRKKKKARQSSTDQRAILVGAAGFEPTASSSRTKRATNCAMPRKYRNPMGCGLVGDERIELPQVESESTALPLCKSPLFGFALSTEALLTRNIIQPPPPFVNHFFDFSVHVFSVFPTSAFSRLFSSPALDTRPLWEYSYSIIHLPPLRENGRNEGCSI